MIYNIKHGMYITSFSISEFPHDIGIIELPDKLR